MRQLSERRGTAISSLEIPSPQYGGSDGFERRSPGSRSPASSTRYSPQYPSEGKLNPRSPGKVVPGARRTGTGGSGRGGTKKGRWRPRVKGVARFLFAFLLVYFFGRTAYQLSFFVKAGLGRYWFYPLATQRPDPCGPRTPPADVLLTSLVPIAGTGTAITTGRRDRRTSSTPPSPPPSASRDDFGFFALSVYAGVDWRTVLCFPCDVLPPIPL